ncbi:hypothetical protein ACHHV8_25605 [Paenibacillus sp. TAB 01]|uniref:hypothetical protein n=1 Tax=Paenibacillus sp. TAB 01 TaxID=3368988 RepID=UPI00375226C1
MEKEDLYKMSNLGLLLEYKDCLIASERNELDSEGQSRLWEIESIIQSRMSEGHTDEDLEDELEEELEEESEEED